MREVAFDVAPTFVAVLANASETSVVGQISVVREYTFPYFERAVAAVGNLGHHFEVSDSPFSLFSAFFVFWRIFGHPGGKLFGDVRVCVSRAVDSQMAGFLAGSGVFCRVEGCGARGLYQIVVAVYLGLWLRKVLRRCGDVRGRRFLL